MTTATDPTTPPAADPTTGPDVKDPIIQGDPEKLGEGGKKALVAERARAEEAERQNAQLRQAQKDQLAAIARALGVDPAKGDAPDDLSVLRDQFAAMRLENEVAKLARTKGITSDDDIALLAAVGDTEKRARLADRLAVAQGSAQQQDQAKKGTVRPDRNQGRNDEGASAKPSSVDAVRDQILAARANK